MLGALRERCARIRAFFRTSDLDRDFEEELQSHVTMHLPEHEAIGRRIRLIESGSARIPSPPLTIVGIAPNVRHAPATDVRPVVYLPWRARPTATMPVMMRSRGNTAAPVSLVREEVRALDADVPLYDVSTLERLSQQSRWIPRAVSSLLGLVAFIATLLSAMGLYAVTTDTISRRTSEIGIRMALGAQRAQVAWLFLRGTLVHVGLGLSIGVAGGVAMGQILRRVLVQSSALDPVTFASVVVLLAAVAGLPASRRLGVYQRWTQQSHSDATNPHPGGPPRLRLEGRHVALDDTRSRRAV